VQRQFLPITLSLILKPPRIVFDTMIFIDAASGALGKVSQTAILPADWSKVANHVNRNYVHAVTPATVVELLTSLANADSKYFSEQCWRLRKLQRSFTNTIFLSWVRYFIRADVFGLEPNMAPGIEYNFRNVIDRVLESKSKEDAYKKVRFEQLAAQRQAHRDDWQRQIATLQGLAKPVKGQLRLDPYGWAETKLKELDIEVTDVNRDTFQTRLDCMYHIENRILELAQNSSWNSAKIQNFIFDQNQTAYLGAEDVVLVTRDNEILDASKNSIQRARVCSWADFLSRC
jgi:hypothetical protein